MVVVNEDIPSRRSYDARVVRLEEKVTELQKDHKELQTSIIDMNATINGIDAQVSRNATTSDVVMERTETLDEAIQVIKSLGMLAKIVKWIGGISAALVAIISAYYYIIEGFPK